MSGCPPSTSTASPSALAARASSVISATSSVKCEAASSGKRIDRCSWNSTGPPTRSGGMIAGEGADHPRGGAWAAPVTRPPAQRAGGGARPARASVSRRVHPGMTASRRAGLCRRPSRARRLAPRAPAGQPAAGRAVTPGGRGIMRPMALFGRRIRVVLAGVGLVAGLAAPPATPARAGGRAAAARLRLPDARRSGGARGRRVPDLRDGPRADAARHRLHLPDPRRGRRAQAGKCPICGAHAGRDHRVGGVEVRRRRTRN